MFPEPMYAPHINLAYEYQLLGVGILYEQKFDFIHIDFIKKTLVKYFLLSAFKDVQSSHGNIYTMYLFVSTRLTIVSYEIGG